MDKPLEETECSVQLGSTRLIRNIPQGSRSKSTNLTDVQITQSLLALYQNATTMEV